MVKKIIYPRPKLYVPTAEEALKAANELNKYLRAARVSSVDGIKINYNERGEASLNAEDCNGNCDDCSHGGTIARSMGNAVLMQPGCEKTKGCMV